jgi:peptidoglycan/xylan/chitin deacetylase (PgdA/CDA1 family)
MKKVITRGIVAIIFFIIFAWLFIIKYFAPYYIRFPFATTYPVPDKQVYIFPGVKGPLKKTNLPMEQTTSIERYQGGSTSRLAIFLTDENSYWLDLAHGLKAAGIPFTITKDYKEAIKHQVILVYPTIVGLQPAVRKALSQFPERGGTLIAQSLITKPMTNVFGIKKSKPLINGEILSRLHFDTHFSPTANFKQPEQQTINIGNKTERTVATAIYQGASEKPLARYENGDIAMVQKTYAHGHAYALGIDIGRLFLIGYSRTQWSLTPISNQYVNHYEPHIDTVLQLLKNIYQENQKNAVTIAAAPYGKSITVIFTFDNDSDEAVQTMHLYKNILDKASLKGTFFILTKYISDNDAYAFFTAKNLPLIKAIVKAGMEVTSEGVSHSFNFDQFPLGTGKEYYPKYRPFIMHTEDITTKTILKYLPKQITYNGSILGELRVSRFLLHHFFPSLKLKSFRPGFLKNPFQLAQSLASTHFSYNSSTTSGDTLTHLPYQLNFNRNIDTIIQEELPVYEFPISVEDQNPPAMNLRIDEALSLAKKISSFGGIYVVLIHPDGKKATQSFLYQFIKKVPKVTKVWFSTMGDFGDWWAARDNVGIDLVSEKNQLILKISAKKKISGLTLILPQNFKIASNDPKIKLKQVNNQLIVKEIPVGNIEIKLRTDIKRD